MSFTSLTFLLFAALTVLVYYLVPSKVQWVVLLVASLAFYASAGVWYLPFILLTVASTYLCAHLMARRARRDDAYLAEHKADMDKDARKAFKAKGKKARFGILLVALILNFGILGVLKYTGFVMEGIGGIVSLFGGGSVSVPTLIVPLGISYYMFRSTSYAIDVYRGKTEAATNPARYALFVCFFPSIVQGPISRYGDLAPQLCAPHKASWDNLSQGFLRILWGYFKKLVIADTAMIAVKVIIGAPNEFTGMYVLLAIVLYSAVIYGDFTGGIDVTIGLSRMLGLEVAENFDRPFSSHSTQEYWNRWHITMGSWFTDYVFYPLSICKPMQRLTKWSKAHLGKVVGMRLPVYLATLVTWFLTGLWHGASWNFIVWGVLNGVIILISRELSPLYAKFHKRFPKLGENVIYGGFCAVRTFFLMGSIRILDVYRDVPVTARAFFSMFYDFASWGELFDGRAIGYLDVSVASWVVLIAAVVTVFIVSRMGRERPVAARLSAHPVAYAAVCAVLVTVIVILGTYGIGYNAGDFIYGQF